MVFLFGRCLGLENYATFVSSGDWHGDGNDVGVLTPHNDVIIGDPRSVQIFPLLVTNVERSLRQSNAQIGPCELVVVLRLGVMRLPIA